MMPGADHFSARGFSGIAQNKDQRFFLTWSKGQIDLVAGNRRPAACYGIGTGAFFYNLWMVIAPVGTEKGIPAGIKSVDRRIDPIKSKVIAALAVTRSYGR